MRPIPTLKISVSGVRGVIGDSLTPEMVVRFAQAFGTYVGGGRVVIVRDPRTSGEMMRQAVVAGLVSSGCRVSDLGVCPTPTVQLLVRQLGASGGIAITASHNPPEWNALKFVGGNGLFLSAARGRELLDIYHQGDYTKVPGARQRAPERIPDAVERHVAAVVDGIGRLPGERTAPQGRGGPGRRRGRGGGAATRGGPRRRRGGHPHHRRRPLPPPGGAGGREPRRPRRGGPHRARRRRLRPGHGRRPAGGRGRHREGHRRGADAGPRRRAGPRPHPRPGGHQRGDHRRGGGHGRALRRHGHPDPGGRGQRGGGHAPVRRGDRGRGQRRRPLPQGQLRARQPGGHGPHPPPPVGVGAVGGGPGGGVRPLPGGEDPAALPHRPGPAADHQGEGDLGRPLARPHGRHQGSDRPRGGSSSARRTPSPWCASSPRPRREKAARALAERVAAEVEAMVS